MSNIFGMLKHLAKTRNFEFSPDFLYHSFSQQESPCHGGFTPRQGDGAVSKDPSLETPCSLSPFCLPMTFDLWIGFLWMTFDFWIGRIQGPNVTRSDQSDSNQTMLSPCHAYHFTQWQTLSRRRFFEKSSWGKIMKLTNLRSLLALF